MPSIPPTQGSRETPEPDKSSSSKDKPPPQVMGGGGGSMTDFMAQFTPEDRKKFMDILIRNISREIDKADKRHKEELRREREEM